ncbi:MAG: cyclic nucleotide-binding domain-containing protein, partial [Bacteriovorax sp.]|nr:cyclic nucleotide-binding domain-containing protein [Bacteriovorax sp.]
MPGSESIILAADEILFLAEEYNVDLYLIKKGKVMVFVQKGSQITPIAYLGKGEYIGELSFFDDEPRSASIICVEETEFVKIGSAIIQENFPSWLKNIGLQLSRKIRAGDELIRSKGIRK